MEFRLELRPLHDYVPMTGVPGPLLWSYLAVGWISLDIDGQVLRWADTSQDAGDSSIGVWHFWESLVDVIPSVREPVTATLAELLAQDEFWQWYPRLEERCADNPVTAWKAINELQERALGWLYDERQVPPISHCGPSLFFWLFEETVHIRWGPVFTQSSPQKTPFGKAVVPWEQFIEAIVHFDSALMEKMGERLRQVIEEGALENKLGLLTLDEDSMRSEHRERAARLGLAFAKEPPAREWITVYSALKTLRGFLALG